MPDGTTPPTQPATASGRTASSSKNSSSSKAGAAATASQPSTFNGTTSAPTGVQAALHAVDQLKDTVAQLEQELQSYNDVNVAGRDTILLRSYFDQGIGRFMQISQALRLGWTPPVGASRGR